MAFPTVDDCKATLRIQTDAENALLGLLLTGALASVEAYVRRPLIAEERTFVVGRPVWGIVRSFFVPIYPVAAAPALTLTDATGALLVEGTDYRVDLRTGEVTALTNGVEGGAFGDWPQTVMATVGLSADPRYADRIEPALSMAILDVVADYWHRRNPSASNEAAGGGVATAYDVAYGLPTRICAALDPFRMPRAR